MIFSVSLVNDILRINTAADCRNLHLVRGLSPSFTGLVHSLRSRLRICVHSATSFYLHVIISPTLIANEDSMECRSALNTHSYHCHRVRSQFFMNQTQMLAYRRYADHFCFVISGILNDSSTVFFAAMKPPYSHDTHYNTGMCKIHCVQKKTPTHIFFHISMNYLWI